jgi:hypothetical protein
VRVAVGGGALVLAGVLALPLSGSLFSSETSAVRGDYGTMLRDVAADASGPTGADDTAKPSPLNKQEMASLLQVQPPEPALTSGGLQYAVSVAEAPTSTASIAPPAPRPEPTVQLPLVELPEPLAAKDVLASPIVATSGSSVREKSETVAAAPSSGGSAAGTRIASLGDVAVLPAPPALSNAQKAALLNRAQELVLNRDISSARLVLEKALSGGSAQAAFQLAETYDPQMLAAWSVRGIEGDAARAKELYATASSGGVATAADRLKGLEATVR